MKNIPLALTYDDVLLTPSRSNVLSRKDVDTSTFLTPKICLQIPIVSANMDTVTEADMAIEMAKFGGIGIIHRFMSIEDEAKEILKVKRWANYVIENPVTVGLDSKIGNVKDIMLETGISGIIVLDKEKRVVGIVTDRDIMYEKMTTKVKDVMTSWDKLIVGDPKTNLNTAQKLLHKYRKEKLPLVDKNRSLKGLITLKDIQKSMKYTSAAKDKKGRLLVGAAIGVSSDTLDRAEVLVKADCDVLVLDIAHGHLDLAINTLKLLKKNFKSTEVVAGNVATFEGARDLVKAGADAIKVGVGPGSMCTTRIVTGIGVPQLSAVMEAVRFCADRNVPVIADGGIKTSGDIVKALAAGASTVMLGGLLAGTDESPGFPIIKNGRKYKVTRGMASLGANVGRAKREKSSQNKESFSEYVAEGVEALVPYKGNVNEILHSLMGGVRSGMSYCGVKTIADMPNKAKFVRITNSGMRESKPHDVEVV